MDFPNPYRHEDKQNDNESERLRLFRPKVVAFAGGFGEKGCR